MIWRSKQLLFTISQSRFQGFKVLWYSIYLFIFLHQATQECNSSTKTDLNVGSVGTLPRPYKDMFDRSTYKWCLNANVISYEPGWKRCNQPFLIQMTVVFKRTTSPFLIVYVIRQNCHLQPLRAGRFISKLPLVSATHPISTSFQKCHHFINLARHEIREGVHQSCQPTERTEPCMSPLHSSHHTHTLANTQSTSTHPTHRKDLLCSKLSFRNLFLFFRAHDIIMF